MTLLAAILAQGNNAQTIPRSFPHYPPTLAASGRWEKMVLHDGQFLQNLSFENLGGTNLRDGNQSAFALYTESLMSLFSTVARTFSKHRVGWRDPVNGVLQAHAVSLNPPPNVEFAHPLQTMHLGVLSYYNP